MATALQSAAGTQGTMAFNGVFALLDVINRRGVHAVRLGVLQERWADTGHLKGGVMRSIFARPPVDHRAELDAERAHLAEQPAWFDDLSLRRRMGSGLRYLGRPHRDIRSNGIDREQSLVGNDTADGMARLFAQLGAECDKCHMRKRTQLRIMALVGVVLLAMAWFQWSTQITTMWQNAISSHPLVEGPVAPATLDRAVTMRRLG